MAVINSYEAVIVISLKLGEEGIAETIAKFKDMVSKNGTLENVDEWGKRRLAYEIQKMKEGFYYVVQFDAPTSAPAEIESRIRIMDNVMRYLVVKREEA